MKSLLQQVGIFIAALSLAGCARSCEGCSRATTGPRNYEVKQYSGGVLIETYTFKGVLNNQESSDGFYWYQGDTLFEVSGDLKIKSW